MEETIKPRRNQRARGVFEDMRKQSELNSMPNRPRSGTMQSSNGFDSAPMPGRPRSGTMQSSNGFDPATMPNGNFADMSNLSIGSIKQEQFDGTQYSPVSSEFSHTLSYQSSPEVRHMEMLRDPFVNQQAPMMYPEPPTAHGLPTASPAPAPYRRSESVSSINLEETITETGITIDDIATFISGPDPADGRWLCLYPDCGKRFGRKENIKSHVQTHLGDRQFQCPHCKKCFVRQHDLKRHAKIHSGIKPYPCQCGNSFARHDALTRHRQRGMCIGAFEGVVKKNVKRGRPRKNRPDNEERLAKSSRTRSKNKSVSSVSSTTGSESTSAHSPRSDLDDILDGKPFGDYDYSRTPSVADNGFLQARSPIPDYVSPQAIQGAHSPSAFSTHSTIHSHRSSVASISEHLPSHPATPAKSVHSQYHSPPGLCDSSSSPAPSHYYDFDNTPTHGEFKDLATLGNITEHDDELFLEAFASQSGHDGITQLEREPDLLMGKFEDAFGGGRGDDLFRTGAQDDIFFGSP